MLEEAVTLGQAISSNKMNLPVNFCDFEVGPDKGFDGDTWAWALRNLEQIDWTSKMKDEDFIEHISMLKNIVRNISIHYMK